MPSASGECYKFFFFINSLVPNVLFKIPVTKNWPGSNNNAAPKIAEEVDILKKSEVIRGKKMTDKKKTNIIAK